MSNHSAGCALRLAALVGLMVGTTALSGCSTFGMRGGDITGSVGQTAVLAGSQAMPAALRPAGNLVASGPFVPPADIGAAPAVLAAPTATVSRIPLPPVLGNSPMPAQSALAQPLSSLSAPALASVPGAVKPAALPVSQDRPVVPAPVVPAPGVSAPVVPALSAKPIDAKSAPAPKIEAPAGGLVHTIAGGESLYTIARRYDVTAQTLVQANMLGAPDRIVVGQKIVIPRRSGGVNGVSAAGEVATASPIPDPAPPQAPAPAVSEVALLSPQSGKVAPKSPVSNASPAMSGAEKFRWPVSGKVIADFAATSGIGIDIAAPEGAAVRAAENGQVVYAGSGLANFGNLVLVSHRNGYVSAYAHLKTIAVKKGQNVMRGDNIGQVGTSGVVKSPQLHFELRKGATPVDPVPLLAG